MKGIALISQGHSAVGRHILDIDGLVHIHHVFSLGMDLHKDLVRFVKITPDRCLIFPSVEFVRNMVLKLGSKSTLPVVIDCTYIFAADYTAAKVISSIVDDFRRRQQKIIFFNLKPSVVSVFEGLNTRLVLCYNTHALNQELRPDEADLSRSVDSLDHAESGNGASECVSMASTLSLARS